MDLSWDIAGQLAWTGLATSTYYALFAVAFALVLKVNQVWNFGQAGMMVLGYFALYTPLRLLGWPLPLALAFALLLTIAAALAIEWFAFRILRERNSSVLTFFIFTIALSQCAIYLGELIFGADPKTLFTRLISPVFLIGRLRSAIGICRRWRLPHVSCRLSLSSCALPRTGNSFLPWRTIPSSPKSMGSAPVAPTRSR